MIIDQDLATPDLGHVDVCIVGAGPAGITLAAELAGTAARVVVLEEGGLEPAPGGRPIYEVVPGPRAALGTSEARTLWFGGNSNHWYGNCRPLDESDFEERPWIPGSGWPIRRDDLTPYYERALSRAGLSGIDVFDVETCRPDLGLDAPPWDTPVLSTRIVQTTPEFSLGVLHRELLAAAPNVTVVLGCHALGLSPDDDDRVRQVRAVRGDGSPVDVTADRFVIATGGVENARLLLASKALLDGGASAVRDMTGRCFQEHWYYAFATSLTSPPRSRRAPRLALFDAGGGDRERQRRDHRRRVRDAEVWGQLVLSDEVARREQLPGLALWFTRSLLAPSGLVALREAVRGRRGLASALREVLRHPLVNLEYVWRRLVHRGEPARRLTLIAQVEQPPDPSSRITLTDTTDAWGVPQATLDTRLEPTLRRSHARALELAADALGLDGRQLAREMERRYRSGTLGYFWHHVGTTRMSDDPRSGVVDRDCKVHGVENLYVAGSSVFPTSGTAGPTLTIVALAVRLADHLAGLVQPARGS